MRFSVSRAGRLLLPLAVAAALLGGCHDDGDPIQPPGPEAAGREYFPLAVGRYWEYDVAEKFWNFNVVDSTANFQLREEVDTVFRGATGELNYRIVRSLRRDSSASWREDSTLALVVNADVVRRTFANVPTVQLLFPVREGKSWNPNLYNSADSTTRSYAAVGAAMTLPATRRTFDRTLRVVDEPQESLVARREQEAAYAWNVGCIYRRRLLYDYCNQLEASQGLCQFGQGYKARGSEREEQLRKWGQR